MLGAWQIDQQIAFLSLDAPVHTPFGRLLHVTDQLPWEVKTLRARLRALDVGKVDIRRRGLAGDVERVRRDLRLSGSRHAVLVMTRHRDRPWALICTPVDPADAPASGQVSPSVPPPPGGDPLPRETPATR
jgi:hypothetical protein